MSGPLLLDLFCGAGGAGGGYAAAGFEVVGVDLTAQPNYPFVFRQGDALACLDTLLSGRSWGRYRLSDFAAIHASPPCQSYSVTKALSSGTHPKLIADVKTRCYESRLPWVIENVSGSRAALPNALMLCGTMFGLHVYRHRLFESSHMFFAAGACHHPRYLMDGYLCVYGSGARGRQKGNRDNHYERATLAQARVAMGIDWMSRAELSQAIPPAYTAWIGAQLMRVVTRQAQEVSA